MYYIYFSSRCWLFAIIQFPFSNCYGYMDIKDKKWPNYSQTNSMFNGEYSTRQQLNHTEICKHLK